MSLTASEIKELMEKAKELGLSHIKVDGFEAQLSPLNQAKLDVAPMVELTDKEIEALVTQPSPFDDLTDEEIFYYATPYYEELQAKKQAHAEKLKEEEATRGK